MLGMAGLSFGGGCDLTLKLILLRRRPLSGASKYEDGFDIGPGDGVLKDPETVADAALRPGSIMRTLLAGELSLVRGRSGSIVEEDCRRGEDGTRGDDGDCLRSMLEEADLVSLRVFRSGVVDPREDA